MTRESASGRSPVRRVSWNADERRLRAPWRLAVGVVCAVLCGVAGLLLGAALDGAVAGAGVVVATVAGTVGRSGVLLGAAGGVLFAARFVDRREQRDLGLGASAAWWADLGFGLALGVALPGLVFALELAAGLLRVTGTVVTRPSVAFPAGAGVPFAVAFALVAGYFAVVGFVEELVFRGYLLVNAAEGLCWAGPVGARAAAAAAAALTSVLFGVAHGSNPNATPLAVGTIALYGGLLAAAFLLTGRLALPVGFHVAWNLSVSSVYGFPVSGLTTPVTLVAVEQSGPALVTGGRFGPEGGLVSLVALAAGAALLAWWVRRREGQLALRESVATPDLRSSEDGRED
ncbi:MAG: CPBP family intramembrane glutamic endopeptidase [Haloarculaceae archaeon]